MSYGYDEFESKLGQFIYTMIMYERLKEYLVEKVRGRGRISIRIDLGKDKAGNSVVMDITLSSISPLELKVGKEVTDKREGKRKNLLIMMSNNKVRGNEKEIAKEVEKLITESLKWWHGYFGERDRLSLDDWKTEKCSVVEGFDADFLIEVPVDRIITPQKRRTIIPEIAMEKLVKIVDLLSYPSIKSLGDGVYEIVTGDIQLLVAKRLGKETVKAVLLEVDEDSADRLYKDYVDKVYKALKVLT